jgi:membrane-associated phospholipid phosphatase
LSALWIVVLGYQIITIFLILVFDLSYFVSSTFLISRLVLIIYFIYRYQSESFLFTKNLAFFDTLVIYLLLSFFYGETGYLNTFIFPKIDPFLIAMDEWIFGFQPSVVFSSAYHGKLFSELMFLGYFSYYLMPFFAFIFVWTYKREHFEEFSFIILSGYFFYYLIFILVPAAGPQFYLSPPLNQIESSGLFADLVKLIQKYGEAPTAAFPSSHIGISFILLILLFKFYRKLFIIYLPFSILLLFSTIYIKAHYVFDVLAGILSGPLMLILSRKIYVKHNLLYVHRD